jgi:hypothetical protein
MLWDPYYRLNEDLRERLLDYYIQGMIERSGGKFIEEDFRKTLLTCRLQRHMQALGAYGFLSSVKGKKYFEDSTQSQKEYPELYKLVNSL